MHLPEQIAKQFRKLYSGGNWTAVNVKESLAGISWEQATAKLYSLNSIASLVYHMDYYVRAVSAVLNGESLRASDKYSFDLPPVQSPEDWEKLLAETWKNAEIFATRLEQLPEHSLWETFSDGKYGNYYRNIHGVIEHTHYHLGQIVLIKKLLLISDISLRP